MCFLVVWRIHLPLLLVEFEAFPQYFWKCLFNWLPAKHFSPSFFQLLNEGVSQSKVLRFSFPSSPVFVLALCTCVPTDICQLQSCWQALIGHPSACWELPPWCSTGILHSAYLNHSPLWSVIRSYFLSQLLEGLPPEPQGPPSVCWKPLAWMYAPTSHPPVHYDLFIEWSGLTYFTSIPKHHRGLPFLCH